MATTPAPKAGRLVHEDTPLTTQDTPRVPEGTDDPAPPTKRQRRSIRTRSSTGGEIICGECDSTEFVSPPMEPPPMECPPPMQKEVPPTVFGTSACDHGVGLRLIDVSSLSKGLDHLCCRACSESQFDARTEDFFKFYEQKLDFATSQKKRKPTLQACYEEFKHSKSSSSCFSSVSMQSETVGFATTLHFRCKDIRHKVSVEPQKVSPDFLGGYANKDCHSLYWVNYLVVMFMHRIGCGMYHAQLLALLGGLPRFFPNPLHVLSC